MTETPWWKPDSGSAGDEFRHSYGTLNLISNCVKNLVRGVNWIQSTSLHFIVNTGYI
jgi:hypothetical protein